MAHQGEKNIPGQLKERLKASYDAIAPTYNTWTDAHSPLRLKYLDSLFANCSLLQDKTSDASVLELGCGAGVPILDTILSRHPRVTVTGNDLSTTQLELAQKNLSQYSTRTRWIGGDMTLLTFPSGSFDAVIALYSLVHLPQHEQADMLSKIAAWLKPDGFFLANFTTDTNPGSVTDEWLHEKGWMYWSGLGPKETNKIIGQMSLDILEGAVDGDQDEKFYWVIATKSA